MAILGAYVAREGVRMMKFKLAMLCMVLSLSAVMLTTPVQAQRIKDIANVQAYVVTN